MADIIYDFGRDIDSSWTFQDGDLQLIQDSENLTQAIQNRLNTEFDSLDLFYVNYGSVLSSFLGWRRNSTTLDFIKLEVDKVVGSDPRITNFESSVSYGEQGKVKIDLIVYYAESEVLELNFVLNNDGVNEVNTDGS